MTSQQHLKKEIMVYAISHDHFGYGSQCYRRADGKWICIVDGERYEYIGEGLAEQFDELDLEQKVDIIKDYFSDVLNINLDKGDK